LDLHPEQLAEQNSDRFSHLVIQHYKMPFLQWNM